MTWNVYGTKVVKAWTYEYKYRRGGGKRIVHCMQGRNCVGFMIILGKMNN